MNAHSLALNDILSQAFPDRNLAAQCMAMAVGLTIANRLSLPTAPVESENQAFNEANLVFSREEIAKLNELTVFDTDEAERLCRAYWMVRYHALHPEAPYLTGVNCIVTSLTHGAKYFSTDDFALFESNAQGVASLMAKINEILGV